MTIRSAIFGSMLRAWSHVAPTERGAFHLVRAARRFMPASDRRDVFHTPSGIQLNLDLDTYPDCCMAFGLYELDTFRLLRRLLKPGMTFVDCGANLGYFTLAAARWVGPTGRVEAFEPDPTNRSRLIANIDNNREPAAQPTRGGAAIDAPIVVHPIAVADRAGEIDFFHPEGGGFNHGMAGAFASAAPSSAKFSVPCVRLDALLSVAPDVVKIDIEGGELAALRGMEKLLTVNRPPTLIVESSPMSARLAGHEPAELFRTIRSIQPAYRIFWIGATLRELGSAAELAVISRQGNLLAKAPHAD